MSGNKQAGVNVPASSLLLEEALLHCSFGRFHYRLLLACLASTYACTMVTTTSSYLLPNTECELGMSIMQKGLLNAGPFFGVVCSTILCCFFIDSYGRRPFLIGAHAVIFIFSIIEASSQNYWNLLLMKVLEGAPLILSLVSSLVIVGELTHKKLRDRFLMFIVSYTPLSLIGVALISWALLPHQNWHFVIWKGYFELHSWNIYLYVCSVFSLIATVLYYTIPESPRFLFYQRRESEALEVLKGIYSENTGKHRDSFPIKTLGPLGNVAHVKITVTKRIKVYVYILKQLFCKPLVYQMLLFACLSFVSNSIYSTIRLWYPQMSTIVENYRIRYGNTDRFCTMINSYTEELNSNTGNLTVSDVCVPIQSGPETYINVIVMSLITFFAINISGFLIKNLGHKLLMFLLFILCSVSCGALYWCSSSQQIAWLVALTCAFVQASLGLQKIALRSVFSTTFKTLGLSIIIMSSRAGAIIGNILFPVMLQIDCMVPFLTFSVAILCCSSLVYFVQNPAKESVTDGK